jgi:PAS domain S-box-containing protein
VRKIELTENPNNPDNPLVQARLVAACLDAAGVCIAVLAAERIVTANVSLHKLLGYRPSELEGRDWRDIVPSERHHTFERLYGAVADGHGHALCYELILLDAQGERHVMEVTQGLVSLPDFSGQVLTLLPPRRDRPLESAEYLSAICSRCGNIRDDHPSGRGQGQWLGFLEYVSAYELGRVTHSLCPDCADFLLNSK